MSSELNLLSTLTNLLLSVERLEKVMLKSSEDTQANALIRFRQVIRSELLLVQNRVSDKYSNKITKYIMFSVVLSIDEKCKMMISKMKSPLKWNDFQIEFFQRSDGGEYFFHILEDLISNKIYPKICYEILLIILLNGFLGRYYKNPNHNARHRYIVDLKKIIKEMDMSEFQSALESVEPLSQSREGYQFKKLMWTSFIMLMITPVGLYFLSQYY
ncbi:DotU family type IV/VI secretion system protein [uncultured Shewanella sp.]|uniref:DotU family type IV/VI secretion system protein n=1 Tax=uncultured Shewanella sp. TaxID=173975 RepID=UPI00260C41E2|nr:DotU family type IV/VI secretion system protein [uncultured Shewanella sp.]